MMIAVLFILSAYLIGAVPFGLLVGLARGVDIRKHGSGNIGATNAGRVLGQYVGYLVFILDFLKGFVPVLAGGMLLRSADLDAGRVNPHLVWVLIAAGCVLGHMFPVYLKFKGGKGVATSLGVVLGIYPYFLVPSIVVLLIWIAVTGISRYVSLGSIAAASAFPLVFLTATRLHRGTWPAASQLWPLHAFGVVIAALVIFRHRANIRRLLNGTENKIGSSRPT